MHGNSRGFCGSAVKLKDHVSDSRSPCALPKECRPKIGLETLNSKDERRLSTPRGKCSMLHVPTDPFEYCHRILWDLLLMNDRYQCSDAPPPALLYDWVGDGK